MTTSMTKIYALRVLLLVVIIGGWQLASGTVVKEFFISKPSVIVMRLWEWAADGSLFFHAGITAMEAVSGFLIGGFLGMAFGITLGRSQFLAKLLDPFIMTFYSLPKVALAPLFILWIGIGMDMKIVLVASIVFFLVFLNTYTGVRNVSHELISILNLMGGREKHVLTKVVIPSAIHWVFAGLRLSVPYSLIGAIVGELIASNRGLGYLLSDSQGQFDTGGVFAALIAIMILAILMNMAVKAAEALAMPWRSAEQGREVTI